MAVNRHSIYTVLVKPGNLLTKADKPVFPDNTHATEFFEHLIEERRRIA
jgi:hypothetical protein